MGVYYELRAAGLVASKGADGEGLVEVSSEDAGKSLTPVVEVLSPEEFLKLEVEDFSDIEALQTLEDSESNFIDLYPKFVIGSFAIPRKDSNDLDTFAFYMDRQHLIFIDKYDTAQKILEALVQSGAMRSPTTGHCLYVFMKKMLYEDLEYMDKIEDQMEALEERLMEEDMDVSTSRIMRYRRVSMRFVSYYQQLATMAALLSDDENKLMRKDDSHWFDHMENLADRLSARAQNLREYSLQLHELHQTHIDLKQNSIMQVFTIVTVLFAPLTLVTGWFGMNLTKIPGIGMDSMWLVLLIVFAVCTAGLLLFFRKKKWL